LLQYFNIKRVLPMRFVTFTRNTCSLPIRVAIAYERE